MRQFCRICKNIQRTDNILTNAVEEHLFEKPAIPFKRNSPVFGWSVEDFRIVYPRSYNPAFRAVNEDKKRSDYRKLDIFKITIERKIKNLQLYRNPTKLNNTFQKYFKFFISIFENVGNAYYIPILRCTYE
jgi:hypothetical protein